MGIFLRKLASPKEAFSGAVNCPQENYFQEGRDWKAEKPLKKMKPELFFLASLVKFFKTVTAISNFISKLNKKQAFQKACFYGCGKK